MSTTKQRLFVSTYYVLNDEMPLYPHEVEIDASEITEPQVKRINVLVNKPPGPRRTWGFRYLPRENRTVLRFADQVDAAVVSLHLDELKSLGQQ